MNGETVASGEAKYGDIISLDFLGHKEKAAVTLRGYDAEDNETASVTETYTGWEKQNNTVVYMEQAARPAWNQCYAYVWGSAQNEAWPGVQAELLGNGVYKYVLPYQYELDGSYGNVIFNNGSGQQFDAGRINPGQKMIYTADGKWIAYEEKTPYTMGDVNLDGEVDINDATLIQKAAAKFESLSELQTKLADVSGDGGVTVKDATFIQKYIAKYTSGFGSAGEMIYV